MLHKTFIAVAIFFLLLLCSTESFADWHCLTDIHKSALSDMTGLQQAITSIRVNSKDITKKPDTKHCNILTVAEQDNVPTIYTDSDLRKYGGTSDSTGGQTFDSGSAQSPQRSKNSTDNSSKQTSVQCPKCDVIMEKAQKMIDTKGTKIVAIDAMIDLANTCYAACRGESSDSMYQRKIERKLDNIEHDLQFKH